ncbi:MAG: autotransporter outer membrane beta-barrel domain-containing protein [Thiohalocapsa sp.]
MRHAYFVTNFATSTLLVAMIVLCVIVILPATASAYEPTSALGGFGQTTLQQQSGDVVTAVCTDLGKDNSRSSQQEDLFNRCGNMVQNANALAENGKDTEKSLGLDGDQLGDAVQTVVTEEIASTRTISNEIGTGQLNSAIGRLSALRSAIGSGGGASADIAPKWGFFVNGHYGTGDRDGTDREDAFDYDRWGFTAGADYRLSDDLVLGGLVSYSNIDSNFDVTEAVPGGGIEAESWGLGLYSTYYHDNWYVDGLVAYNQTDYDIDRRILLPLGEDPAPGVEETNRTARSSTNSNDWTLSIGGGMDFNKANLTYGPFVRLNYINADMDGYSETGAIGLNLSVDDQNNESLTSVLGGRISAAMSQKWGVLVPQARVGWIHEFLNDADTFTAVYTVDPQQTPLLALSDEPDRDYFTLGVGVSAVLPKGVQAFLDYQTLLGNKYVNDHLFSAGVRAAF